MIKTTIITDMDIEALVQQQKLKEISDLERDIKRYEKYAKQDSGDNACYLLSRTYEKLAALKEKPELHTKAIECITKAIELNPTKGSYYVRRIDLNLILLTADLNACIEKYKNEAYSVDFDKLEKVSLIETDMTYATKLISEKLWSIFYWKKSSEI